jgi:hypothetical protein
MPIITKPGSIQKNTPATITLNKLVLAVNSIVAADTYFSDSTNWNEVIINYKSSVGGQKKSLVFNASLSSPTASFLVSLKARDTFEVQDIVITDFDSGFLKINRSALTTTDFDISFGGGSGGSGNAIVWNLLGSNLIASGSGLTSSGTGWGVANIATSNLSQTSNSSNWTYTFNVSLGATKEFSCGIYRSTNVVNGYSEVDYGFHVGGGGNVDISTPSGYAAVSNVANIGSGNHELKVVRVGDNVTWFVNNTQVHTSAGFNTYAGSNNTAHPVFAFYNSTAQGVSLVSSSKS